MKKVLLFCATCLLMASCSLFESNKPDISHYPFKENKKDNWGLIDANGKVLIEDEFENEPTNPVNGIFFVENNKGSVEMYSIDNPTMPIGDRYKEILPFFEEVTPSVKKDEGIKYIDKTGNVKFEIPIEYHTAYSFLNGYSVIVRKDKDTKEDIRDAVSTDGQIIKFKKYSILSILEDNTFVVSENNENFYLVDQNGDIKTKLKDFTDYSSRPADYTSLIFSPDRNYYVYADDDLMEFNTGIRNINGDVAIKIKEDRLCLFLENGNIMYINRNDENDEYEEEYGVMDINGNILIKARYSSLQLMGKDLYVASKNEKYGLINDKEDILIPFDYADMDRLTDEIVIAKIKDDDNARVSLLDKKGKELGDYAKFESDNYYSYIFSDYFDVSEMISTILKPNEDNDINDFYGYMGLTPGNCVDKMNESYSKDDIGDENTWLPEKNLTYYTDFGSLYYSLGFNEVVVTNTEYDYWGYPSTYYSYSYSPCNAVKARLSLSYKYDDRVSFITKQLPEAMEKCGFTKDSDYYDDYHYMNSNIKVFVEVTDDDVFVTATPIW